MEADLLVLISADFLERRSWELGRAVQRTPTTRQGESADLSAFHRTNVRCRLKPLLDECIALLSITENCSFRKADFLGASATTNPAPTARFAKPMDAVKIDPGQQVRVLRPRGEMCLN